jgi:hypothetical protein
MDGNLSRVVNIILREYLPAKVFADMFQNDPAMSHIKWILPHAYAQTHGSRCWLSTNWIETFQTNDEGHS